MEARSALLHCCQCSQIVVFLGSTFQSVKPVHGLLKIPLVVIVDFGNFPIWPPHLLTGIGQVLNKLSVPKMELSIFLPMPQAAMGSTDDDVHQSGFSRLRVGAEQGQAFLPN